jgi:hypothetical protein
MTSASINTQKRDVLRVRLLKRNMLKRFYAEEGAECAYKTKRDRLEPSSAAASTVASSWARDADNDLRALIASQRRYRKITRRKRLLEKNTNTAGGPPPKRSIVIRPTFNPSEKFKVTVQAPEITNNNARSDLPKTNGTSCLFTKTADCVLNDKGYDSALNCFNYHKLKRGDMDTDEELLPGNDKENDVIILQIDEILFKSWIS